MLHYAHLEIASAFPVQSRVGRMAVCRRLPLTEELDADDRNDRRRFRSRRLEDPEEHLRLAVQPRPHVADDGGGRLSPMLQAWESPQLASGVVAQAAPAVLQEHPRTRISS